MSKSLNYLNNVLVKIAHLANVSEALMLNDQGYVAEGSADGRQIGDGTPGPNTKELLEDFRQRVLIDGVQVYEKVVAKSKRLTSLILW